MVTWVSGKLTQPSIARVISYKYTSVVFVVVFWWLLPWIT